MAAGRGHLLMQFDISRFTGKRSTSIEYHRQLERLKSASKHTGCIEDAVDRAAQNLREKKYSFVIYGEPQSGKTEMMICLTAKLIDEGYQFILHLLNDSVDLLNQNLGRFAASGLAPAAKHFQTFSIRQCRSRGTSTSSSARRTATI